MTGTVRTMRWGVFALVLALVGVPTATAQEPGTSTVRSGPLTATVHHDPFRITFSQPGRPPLTTYEAAPNPADPAGRYGPLGFAVDGRAEAGTPYAHWGVFAEVPVRWFHATSVVEVDGDTLTVATDDPLGRTFAVTLRTPREGVVEVDARLSDTAGVSATGAAFARSADERHLGFGQQSTGADQTGERVEVWVEEAGPSSTGLHEEYEPLLGDRWQGPPPFPGSNYVMPWSVSSTGYGFLLDSTWLNVFELGSRIDDAWHVGTREPALRYRVYAGPEPADVVERFTADTGRQPEPAPWFFGPWYQPTGSREFQDGLRDFWREQDVPVTVSQRYGHYLPCGRRLNRTTEERRELVDAYHDAGYKVTTYVNPFVCARHPDGAYDEGDEQGYFVQTATGQTYPIPYAAYPDAPWTGMVDFTSPEATAFWQRLAAEAIDDGFDGWMEDFGEYVPPDAVMADGRSGLAAHNEYCTLYHAASHALTWPRRGPDFAQYVRCGYTGTAAVSRIVWGGDPTEDWSASDGLAAAVSQAQSIGLSGVSTWGSDVGGFFALFQSGRVDAELLIRWLQYGAFSGVMRMQAEGYGRPDNDVDQRAQVWDPEVLPHWRRYAKLRTQLFPYIWAAAAEYAETGMPIARHLALAWPDDPMVYSPEAEYQLLFGPDLMVAPVVTEGATERTAYLPAGDWVVFWDAVDYDEATGAFTARADQEVLDGGRLVTVDAPLEEIPVFVRAGTCLELLPPDVDTLADVGERDGLVRLDDVGDDRRELCFAAAGAVDQVVVPDGTLPATGGWLGLLGLLTLAVAARTRPSTPAR